MKYQYILSIGLSNADRNEVVDLPDDFTEEEVKEDYRIWCENFMDGGWWKLEDGDDGEEE